MGRSALLNVSLAISTVMLLFTNAFAHQDSSIMPDRYSKDQSRYSEHNVSIPALQQAEAMSSLAIQARIRVRMKFATANKPLLSTDTRSIQTLNITAAEDREILAAEIGSAEGKLSRLAKLGEAGRIISGIALLSIVVYDVVKEHNRMLQAHEEKLPKKYPLGSNAIAGIPHALAVDSMQKLHSKYSTAHQTSYFVPSRTSRKSYGGLLEPHNISNGQITSAHLEH